MPYEPLPKELVDQAINEQEIPRVYRIIYRKAMSGRSRKASIHMFCLHCMGWTDGARDAVRDCSATGCPLWTVRPYQGID